jgi:urate oxidase
VTGVLGPNEYGLQQRIVQPAAGSAASSRELSVTVRLKSDMRSAYLHGQPGDHLDQEALQDLLSSVTEAGGSASIEELAVSLARQLVHHPGVHEATVKIEQVGWATPEPGGRRFVEVHDVGWRSSVEAGIWELDPAALSDRPSSAEQLSQLLTARWRYGRTDVDWEQVYQSVASALIDRFRGAPPTADYQAIFEAASTVLDRHRCIREISLSRAVRPEAQLAAGTSWTHSSWTHSPSTHSSSTHSPSTRSSWTGSDEAVGYPAGSARASVDGAFVTAAVFRQ